MVACLSCCADIGVLIQFCRPEPSQRQGDLLQAAIWPAGGILAQLPPHAHGLGDTSDQ